MVDDELDVLRVMKRNPLAGLGQRTRRNVHADEALGLGANAEADQIVSGTAAVVDNDLAVALVNRNEFDVTRILRVAPIEKVFGLCRGLELAMLSDVVAGPVLDGTEIAQPQVQDLAKSVAHGSGQNGSKQVLCSLDESHRIGPQRFEAVYREVH